MYSSGETGKRITKIETQKKSKRRVSVFVDGEYVLGVDQDVLLKFPIHEGDCLSDDVLLEIERYETVIQAKNKAMRLIAYRMRSEHELKKRLLEKGCPESAVKDVLQECKRTGLINDSDFAEAFVNTQMVQKPMAKRLLRIELQKKGIAPEIAESAIGKAYEDQTEMDVAKELFLRKSQRISGEPQKVKKHLGDFLARRGFNWDIIRSLLNQIIQEH